VEDGFNNQNIAKADTPSSEENDYIKAFFYVFIYLFIFLFEEWGYHDGNQTIV